MSDKTGEEGGSVRPAQARRYKNQEHDQPHLRLHRASIITSQALPESAASDASLQNKRQALPFPSLPLLSHTCSVSLVPSVAEGRPIPLDQSTIAHRTSALRELQNHPPSSANSLENTKSTGAQGTTYFQPVIVRTYDGPPASQKTSGPRGRLFRPSSKRRRISQSAKGGKLPFVIPWPWPFSGPSHPPDEPVLPPLEAFSFKSIMAEIQGHGGENHVSADLDRIAEICAGSRYSLSNQYDAHKRPHGSGVSSTSGPGKSWGGRTGRRAHQLGGASLPVIPDEDEHAVVRRRRSAACGSLEAIMSSSRSSEEDTTSKRRATAFIDSSRHNSENRTTSSLVSVSLLTSEPALPHTSTSEASLPTALPAELVPSGEPRGPGSNSGLFSGFSAWVATWVGGNSLVTGGTAQPEFQSHAVGSLRQLLRNTAIHVSSDKKMPREDAEVADCPSSLTFGSEGS